MAKARPKSKPTPKAAAKREKAAPKAAKPPKAAKAVKAARPVKPSKPAKLASEPVKKVAAKVEIPAQAERPPKPPRSSKADRAPKDDGQAASQPEAFRLATIERTEPPSGAAGKNWYRYTIRQGANAINGYLQGTAAGVKTAAEQIVGQLNERRAGRWGYRTTRTAAPAQTSS